jgi:folate-binding protein YgfZ
MNVSQKESLAAEYAALREGAALQVRPEHGVLLLSDADRADFLQRMTTNNIGALTPGNSAVTILTSDVARNLFAFTVVCREEDLLLLSGRDEAAELTRALQGKIFFMDKVKVANISQPVRRLRLMGPGAAEILAKLGVDLGDAPDGAWQRAGELTVVKQFAYGVPGYELLNPASGVDALVERLVEGGATLLTDAAAYEVRRIELGRPAPGAEITQDYNPLEAGMAWVCAENKGCYTGQEIIARQVTYDKVTKTLVGLRSSALLEPGAAVTAEGRVVGKVTSAAYSPALDAPIALAILKRPHNTPGSQVMVNDTQVEVVRVPFEENEIGRIGD